MNVKGYLDDVNKEMRKVSWPSQKQLIDNTAVTLVGTLIISLFIYFADQIISRALQILVQ